ncbi:MAG: hypothetical protein ACRYGK_13745 [Janthinobacterium lividum]
MEYNINFNNQQNITVNSMQLQQLAKDYLYGSPVQNRISEYLLLEIFLYNVALDIDPSEIFTAISNLENGIISGVKPATQFKNLPLMGLWHQHFFSSKFIINNIRLGLGKNGTGRLVNEIFTRGGSPIVTREMINELSHRLVHDSLESRISDNKITGEWIVFIKHSNVNYYLSLGLHQEIDQIIYDKIIYNCKRDFPDIEEWISNSRI